MNTNIPFLKELCKNDKFKSFEDIDTNFIRNNPQVLQVPWTKKELLHSYIAVALKQLNLSENYFYSNVYRNLQLQVTSTAPLENTDFTMDIVVGDVVNIKLRSNNDVHEFKNCQLEQDGKEYYLTCNNYKIKMQIVLDDSHVIMLNGNIYKVEIRNNYELTTTVDKVNDIKAPMPSKIIKLLVSEDDTVKVGQSLIVIEAMKMEHVIKSTINGKVIKINSKVGDLVSEKKILMSLE